MTTPTPTASAPESITVSLEWAKKLKEAGWSQRNWLFAWMEFYNSSSTTPDVLMNDFVSREHWESDEHGWRVDERSYLKKLTTFAAPTAEEILRRLPIQIPIQKVSHPMRIEPFADYWTVRYSNSEKFMFSQPSLANAAAAMYCYLADNNLLP